MRRIDIVAATGLLGFVALMVLVIIPGENSEGVWHGLSPYFYPIVMLTGVALSSVGLLVQALTDKNAYRNQSETPLTWSEFGFFLLACVLIFAGVLVLHWLGTWAGGVTLIAALMLFMGERNPLRIAAVVVPTIAVTWVLVTWVLKIPLP